MHLANRRALTKRLRKRGFAMLRAFLPILAARSPRLSRRATLSIIANAAFSGIDHPGAHFGARGLLPPHGLERGAAGPLAPNRNDWLLDRARLGAAMRAAYLVSAAMPRAAVDTAEGREERPVNFGSRANTRRSQAIAKNRIRQLGKLIDDTTSRR
jgi:hypothetical protein